MKETEILMRYRTMRADDIEPEQAVFYSLARDFTYCHDELKRIESKYNVAAMRMQELEQEMQKLIHKKNTYKEAIDGLKGDLENE